jgi:hypothetical protein
MITLAKESQPDSAQGSQIMIIEVIVCRCGMALSDQPVTGIVPILEWRVAVLCTGGPYLTHGQPSKVVGHKYQLLNEY